MKGLHFNILQCIVQGSILFKPTFKEVTVYNRLSLNNVRTMEDVLLTPKDTPKDYPGLLPSQCVFFCVSSMAPVLN